MDAAGQHDGRGESSPADFRADACRCADIAAERPFRVRIIRGHALITAAARVGVRGFADFWLRCILEFSAARQGNEVHAGAREALCKVFGVIDRAAGIDAVFSQHSAADWKRRSDLRAYRREHLERQPNSLFPCAAVAIGPGIERGEK